MSKLYDMRSGTLVKSKLYNNGLNISDVLFKGPLLEADFTTGTYKVRGANKTFDDLFTFNRAGKAWLVKDTGLQEYAADVPRFDNGLLIEQSTTNLQLHSDTSIGAIAGQGAVRVTAPIFDFGYSMPASNQGYFYKIRVGDNGIKNNTSFYVLKLEGKVLPVPGINYTLMPMSDITEVIDNHVSDNLHRTSYNSIGRESGNYIGINNNYAPQPIIDEYVISGFMQTTDTYPSSYIPTTTSTVTRPADFLLNKITGTTVTGDWDSTLTLSIVEGQLVHSGYGRIRSLEIN